MMSASCCKIFKRLVLVIASILPFVFVCSGETGAEAVKATCEVLDFDAYEESQAVLTPAGDYKVTTRRECATVKIRNIYGRSVNIDEFVLTAVFTSAKSAEGEFDQTGQDAKRFVTPSGTYEGVTCFEGDSPIFIMNCEVKR